MDLTFNNYLIALEEEAINIEKEADTKISKLIGKMIDAIQESWNKFISFCKEKIEKIKEKYVTKKLKETGLTIVPESKVKDLAKTLKELNADEEKYKDLIDDLKRRGKDRSSQAFEKTLTSILSTVTQTTFYLRIFQIITIPSGIGGIFSNGCLIIASPKIREMNIKRVKALEENDKKIKLLLKIIADDNLNKKEVTEINSLINKYKTATAEELSMLLYARPYDEIIVTDKTPINDKPRKVNII